MLFTGNLAAVKPRLVSYGRAVYLPFVITGESEVAVVETVQLGGGHGAVIRQPRVVMPQTFPPELAALVLAIVDDE